MLTLKLLGFLPLSRVHPLDFTLSRSAVASAPLRRARGRWFDAATSSFPMARFLRTSCGYFKEEERTRKR